MLGLSLFFIVSTLRYYERLDDLTVICASLLLLLRTSRTRFINSPTHQLKILALLCCIIPIIIGIIRVSYCQFVQSDPVYNGAENRLFVQSLRLAWQAGAFAVGAYIATAFSARTITAAIAVSFAFHLSAGTLQLTLEQFGIPTWGITNKIDYQAIDNFVGFRVNGLLGEPKYFSVYLVSFFAFAFALNKESTLKAFAFVVSLALGVTLFYNTHSSLGIVAIVLCLSILTWRDIAASKYMRPIIATLICICAAFTAFILGSEHLIDSIIGTRSAIRFEFLLSSDGFQTIFYAMDDFILLPTLALLNNPEALPFGFGPGLAHYEAVRHVGLGSWAWELDFSSGFYISSNLGILESICNWGILGSAYILHFTIRQLTQIKRGRTNKSADHYSISAFFGICIVLSLFIGPGCIPLGLSLGLLYGLSQSINKAQSISPLPQRPVLASTPPR